MKAALLLVNDRARWFLPVLSPVLAIAAALLVGAGLISIAHYDRLVWNQNDPSEENSSRLS
ncbi:hypothetical protein [Stenomitos frigidus]|uniref:Uncharacterized protein n=1 Tax=Stenomitos frigidus ULC18 TaxID=2107698 RepID=A0A2T1DYU8_9CYAN|nr:hypothetical protein [Stenomitos frigidus]PSB25639.1 hypothetical protein C7B82_22750 [Stenomitos frigidus ULC18]